MAGIAKNTRNVTRNVIRNLAGLVGSVFAWLFDGVLIWIWLSALLIGIAVFLIYAPIEVVGEGGRSLTEIVAAVAGFFLVSAGIAWAWYKLGDERAERLGGLLLQLIVPAAIVAVLAWLWSSWEVPDIWSRPLAELTLGAVVQNVLKFVVLVFGVSFISDVFREIVARSRRR
jgi:hypothetical protein